MVAFRPKFGEVDRGLNNVLDLEWVDLPIHVSKTASVTVASGVFDGVPFSCIVDGLNGVRISTRRHGASAVVALNISSVRIFEDENVLDRHEKLLIVEWM